MRKFTLVLDNEMVLSKERYEELRKKESFLSALDGAGVDNWEGYPYAQESYDDFLARADDYQKQTEGGSGA